jgi:hypothetical protein
MLIRQIQSLFFLHSHLIACCLATTDSTVIKILSGYVICITLEGVT